jgi:hypothetical protein
MAKTPHRDRRRQQTKLPTGAPDRRFAVVRRCKVCEWEGELIESVGANPDCPWCHAPTELKTPLTAADAGPLAKNPHAAALGRLGGLKGGRARAKALTAVQRHRIALRAARARWGKHKDKDGDK